MSLSQSPTQSFPTKAAAAADPTASLQSPLLIPNTHTSRYVCESGGHSADSDPKAAPTAAAAAEDSPSSSQQTAAVHSPITSSKQQRRPLEPISPCGAPQPIASSVDVLAGKQTAMDKGVHAMVAEQPARIASCTPGCQSTGFKRAPSPKPCNEHSGKETSPSSTRTLVPQPPAHSSPASATPGAHQVEAVAPTAAAESVKQVPHTSKKRTRERNRLIKERKLRKQEKRKQKQLLEAAATATNAQPAFAAAGAHIHNLSAAILYW